MYGNVRKNRKKMNIDQLVDQSGLWHTSTLYSRLDLNQDIFNLFKRELKQISLCDWSIQTLGGSVHYLTCSALPLSQYQSKIDILVNNEQENKEPSSFVDKYMPTCTNVSLIKFQKLRTMAVPIHYLLGDLAVKIYHNDHQRKVGFKV